MKIPVYLDNKFVSYCNFPNKDYHFDFEMTLEEITALFGEHNVEEIIQQAKRLSETTILTFQEALNKIIDKQLNNS